MAVVAGGSEIIVNTGNLGGTQSNVQTARLATGGWVTAWQTDIGGQTDVMFQRFDSAGNKVGAAAIANSTVAGNQVLTDIVATDDGRFTLAWLGTNTVTTRSFSGTSGAAASGEVVVTTTGGTATGAQLVATATGSYKVIHSSENGATSIFGSAEFTTAGAAVSPSADFITGQPLGTSVADATDGAAPGNHFAVLSNGIVLSTADSASLSLGTDARSIVKLQDGTFAVAVDGSFDNAALVALTGVGTNAGAYLAGSPVNVVDPNAATGTAPNSFDKFAINLGGGRILVVAACDPGTNVGGDGVYAQVYNTNTGTPESGSGTQVEILGNITSTATSVSAALLTDGRVAVSWSNTNGLTGFDVFTRIIDPRAVGVNLAGTSAANNFVGTGFDDVFANIAANDVVDGAGGTDTVTVAASAARQIDLADPDRFEGAPSLLTSIENLVGSNLDDEFHGSIAANALSGGLGNDMLFGRAGEDTLNGGDGADLAEGGLGDDKLTGGLGDDVLRGGSGADTVNGSAGLDRVDGGADDDVLAGGGDADEVFGRTGDDQLDGGAGNDYVNAGDGDDLLTGRDGDDFLIGGDGDDTINGGIGNDRIEGGSGINVIDGGAGTDTINYGRGSSNPLLSGFYVDLDRLSGPVGNIGGLEAEDDIITGIENLSGSDADDYLGGSSGANVLKGGGGNDSLLGRGGIDKLFGGLGSDLFIFDRTNGGNDGVMDFLVGADKVGLLSGAFGDIGVANFATRFVKSAGGTPAANGNAQFILQTSGANAGQLTFDGDGNGAGAAVAIATLSFVTATGLTDISVADFVFI